MNIDKLIKKCVKEVNQWPKWVRNNCEKVLFNE